ncbi:MAG TPA: hypothetical protein VGQ12_00750 [Candidatus Angelobacter sp.]|jgi:hypothetical protein|nr:hypothetical protein [Candidatus Angelobacter sp.]
MAENRVAAQYELRPRLKKRPHKLHLCSSVEGLTAELRANDIDLTSLVFEFIKPASEVGVLVTGSIATRIATEVSDLDVLILAPSADVFKSQRRREIAGSILNYVSQPGGDREQIGLFLSGIEVDLVFVTNPDVTRFVASAGVLDYGARKKDKHATNDTFTSRLGMGWVIHGQSVVQRWREYYDSEGLPARWMSEQFTEAAKDLEDMHIGIGLAKGHVSAIGARAVSCLLRALLACNRICSTSISYMRIVNRLISTADSEMRDALITGMRLAFPPLFETVQEEKAYFEDVYAYCGKVRTILSRDPEMVDILASTIHDLDLIL